VGDDDPRRRWHIQDLIVGAEAEADSDITKYWAPTVISSTGFYGGMSPNDTMRLVEGSYKVTETVKGKIDKQRLALLLTSYGLGSSYEELPADSPLVKSGQYKIVVVKPILPPQYQKPDQEWDGVR